MWGGRHQAGLAQVLSSFAGGWATGKWARGVAASASHPLRVDSRPARTRWCPIGAVPGARPLLIVSLGSSASLRVALELSLRA